MPRVGSSIEALGERERLENGHGLAFRENEAARMLDVTDDVHHFALRNSYDVMRKNLNVLLGVFGLHDFFQVEFSDGELTRGVKLGIRQRDTAPLHLPGDTDAVPGVRPDPSG